MIKSLLEKRSEAVLLTDIGARDGILKEYCTDLSIAYRAFDLEPMTTFCREWNIENPFPYSDSKADIITMLEVIEHLNNPWLGIKNITDHLKEDGYLLLTMPNPSWSGARLNLLYKGVLSCFSQEDLTLNHHVFTPWPHIIDKLLQDNGFRIIEAITLDGRTHLFAKPWSPVRFPVQLGFRTLKKMIEAADPASRGMSYAIIAQKKI